MSRTSCSGGLYALPGGECLGGGANILNRQTRIVGQQLFDAVARRQAPQDAPTVMRVPRITGLPIITLGSLWMRGWSMKRVRKSAVGEHYPASDLSTRKERMKRSASSEYAVPAYPM